ncbi:MAG: RluA family pseudouridine synthase [Clostridium sp.]|nr:RluA family pseudouridine synthase [Bacteroides sp.]MCM1197972.1 RluA family pseudouridine synthase [Clostridium sp.]
MQKSRFTYPFRYAPSAEVRKAAGEVIDMIDSSERLRKAFGEGKMLGVLIVSWESSSGIGTADEKLSAMPSPKYVHPLEAVPNGHFQDCADGHTHYGYLAAFSGLAGGTNMIEGFVPPIFDLLNPDGHFKKEEERISLLNRQIASAVETEGTASASVQALKLQRKSMSDNLQKWIFSRYEVLNALGEKKSILDIFAGYGLVPPGGTGECAAPKLLQYAFTHGLTPVAMGEFWYECSTVDSTDGADKPEANACCTGTGGLLHDICQGHSHGGRKCGEFYPSCSSKCGPLLRWMLRGLDLDNPYGFDDSWLPETIWEDEYMMAIAKPAGMLCVPGKDGQISLLERLPQPAYSVHRLDMDTSGIVLVAKTLRMQKELQRQFENREISKTYLAIVDMAANGNGTRTSGSPHRRLKTGEHGAIELPMRPDIDDRPRQIVDYTYGKPASTGYEVLSTDEDKGLALVRFSPHTGRTHQIRVHASHPSGLGCPIAGDLLYGGRYCRRMYLHAESITFRHPMTGAEICLECQAAEFIL